MVVLRPVERVNLSEIVTDRGNMVCDDVNHHPNVSLVAFVNEILQSLFITEVLVDLLPVSSPVAMIASIKVVNNG